MLNNDLDHQVDEEDVSAVVEEVVSETVAADEADLVIEVADEADSVIVVDLEEDEAVTVATAAQEMTTVSEDVVDSEEAIEAEEDSDEAEAVHLADVVALDEEAPVVP